MNYRQLGRSEVEVSAVTFGAWAIGGWLWGPQDDQDSLDALGEAVRCGMTSIDTAAVYGFGHSEVVVGRLLERVGREDVQILTKFGLRWDTSDGRSAWQTHDSKGALRTVVHNGRKKSVLWECEQSLRRLGTDYIDLYQYHWRDPETDVEETMEALDKLIGQGKIRAAGVSNLSIQEMETAREVVELASDQPPYSMLRRDIEADVLPWCREHHVGVLVYSPLERGLLTGKVTMDREFPKDDHRSSRPLFEKQNRRKVLDFLDKLRPIADGHKVSLAQLVIHWTIHQPGITAALVGARNVKQVRENAAAAELELSRDEMKEITLHVQEINEHLQVPSQ